jgi:hypothetical protein
MKKTTNLHFPFALLILALLVGASRALAADETTASKPDKAAVAVVAPGTAAGQTNSPASAEDLARAQTLKKLATEQIDAPPATDAKSFQVLVDGNIFDPYRRPRVMRSDTTRVITPRPDWFLLTGTMSYPNQSARQSYAFFDGSSRNFQQAFKPSDTIADFKITEITNDYVKLTGPDNKVVKLYVQTQMRKPQGGSWSLLASPDAPVEPVETPAAAADDGSGDPAAATAPAASTGNTDEDAVVQALIKKRLEEK